MMTEHVFYLRKPHGDVAMIKIYARRNLHQLRHAKTDGCIWECEVSSGTLAKTIRDLKRSGTAARHWGLWLEIDGVRIESSKIKNAPKGDVSSNLVEYCEKMLNELGHALVEFSPLQFGL